MSRTEDDKALTGFNTRCERLPAFDLFGFSKIVESGGEVYDEVRSDSRWEVLRNIADDNKTIYGVASHDKDAPKGRYRYTLAIKQPSEDRVRNTDLGDRLFSIHVRESEWIVFELENMTTDFSKLWQDNPYNLVKKLGWEYNPLVGLHIDVFPPSYSSNDDPMQFMMPVRRPANSS